MIDSGAEDSPGVERSRHQHHRHVTRRGLGGGDSENVGDDGDDQRTGDVQVSLRGRDRRQSVSVQRYAAPTWRDSPPGSCPSVDRSR